MSNIKQRRLVACGEAKVLTQGDESGQPDFVLPGERIATLD